MDKKNNNIFDSGSTYDINNNPSDTEKNNISFDDVFKKIEENDKELDNYSYNGNEDKNISSLPGVSHNTNNIIDNNKKKIKNKNFSYLYVVFIIFGLLVMLYPFVSNYINRTKHDIVIKNYNNSIKGVGGTKREEMLKQANDYNKNLNFSHVKDVFSTDKSEKDLIYDNVLKVTKDGLMGYLEIPNINVKLPIYHGTQENELNKGVGHFKGSSLPVGGVGTHSILAAHRGLPSSKLFTDLDKLKLGDLFYITILDEKLVYKVDNIAVVKPNELSLLDVDDNQDYVTLVTCTPYGVNTHRLLVRGVRVSDIEVPKSIDNKTNKVYLSSDDKLLIVCLVVITILSIITIFVVKGNKNED